MGELINGRTPEEIKAAVLCTEKGTIPDCLNCPYHGELDENGFRAYQCHQANFDLIAYAELLEAERDAALAKVPKWISVKERLPEHGHEVLVYTDRYGGRTEFAYYVRHLEAWYQNFCLLIPNVTHWMYLPQLPEKDE